MTFPSEDSDRNFLVAMCFLNKVYIKNLFKVFDINLNFWASGNINLKEVFNKNLN